MGEKGEVHVALLTPGGPTGEGAFTKPGLRKNTPLFISWSVLFILKKLNLKNRWKNIASLSK